MARKQLGLNESDKILLTVSTDYRRKGTFELVDALKEIDARLIIIGKDKGSRAHRELKDLIQKTKQESKVILLGNVRNQDLYKWYSASDLFCLPSSLEGCPNVVMEALACGVPVVIKDSGAEFINKNIGIQTTTGNISKDIKKGLLKGWNQKYFEEFRFHNTRKQRSREIANILNKIVCDKTSHRLHEK